MEIVAVDPDSPLFGYVRPGYRLLSVNNSPVRDNLDCMYKLAGDSLRLVFRNRAGKQAEFYFDYAVPLGLTFRKDRVRRCPNDCIFCFVHQQPAGLRKSLYVKDDDYRLSFTHGNFISLSNLTDGDRRRIVEQRLSPLYVSVHSTDDRLRRLLFGSRRLPPVMPGLKDLVEKGIKFHTQVVVMPDLNDGQHLEKTVNDLYGLYPGVKTLGIVPVGLTKYRKHLPRLKPFNPARADGLLRYILSQQRRFLSECGSRFLFAADEFYILCGRKLPGISEYEDMEQFENGIGMMRHLLADFNRRKRWLREKKAKKKKRIALLTGESAYDTLHDEVVSDLRRYGYEIDIYAVKNRFWGRYVTVSGLLTGRDLLAMVKKIKNGHDLVVLPPNCLNDDFLFLDDVSLEQFRKKAGIDVALGTYSIIDTVKGIFR